MNVENLLTEKAEEINEQEKYYKNKMAQAKRKKKFFNVDVPLLNKEIPLIAYEITGLKNRFIQYDLTRILRGKNAILKLKVELEGEKPSATPVELRIMSSYLKRMVRKGTSNIEDSFSTECKNGKVRIKPILVSRRKVSRRIKKALREKAHEELINYLKDKTLDEIFDEVINNRIQKTLGLTLKKIYPLSLCEIRILKVETVNK
jgi:ribosomal protein S3AE